MKSSDTSVLDNQLATLSVKVAQEIDRRLKGKRYNRGILRKWGEQLSRASGIDNPNSTAFLESDPTTTEIFAQAVEAASEEPVPDISHLAAAVKDILQPITADEGELSDETLAAVKLFSLALHRSLMAQGLPSWREQENAFQDDFRIS
jgi:hypothetical protein